MRPQDIQQYNGLYYVSYAYWLKLGDNIQYIVHHK